MKPEFPIALVIAGTIVFNECAGSHSDPHLEVSIPVNSVPMYNYQQEVSSGSNPGTVTRDVTIPLEFKTEVVSDSTVNLEWT